MEDSLGKSNLNLKGQARLTSGQASIEFTIAALLFAGCILLILQFGALVLALIRNDIASYEIGTALTRYVSDDYPSGLVSGWINFDDLYRKWHNPPSMEVNASYIEKGGGEEVGTECECEISWGWDIFWQAWQCYTCGLQRVADLTDMVVTFTSDVFSGRDPFTHGDENACESTINIVTRVPNFIPFIFPTRNEFQVETEYHFIVDPWYPIYPVGRPRKWPTAWLPWPFEY